MTTLTADVAIAGAGLAGMSLALDLARMGRRVVLLERRRRPGGAVLSLPGADGADNSIHLFLSAFTRCQARLEELGSRPHLRALDPRCHVELQERLIRLPLGSSRLATLMGLLRVSHPQGRGIRLLVNLLRLERNPPRAGETAAAWLARANLPHTGPSGIAGWFWREWGLSVFNAPLERVDAGLFRRTQRAVFADPRAHRPLVADCSLDDLWVKPFERALEQAGVRLLSATALRGVERQGLRVEAFLADGLRVEAAQLVWAGTPEGLSRVQGLEDCCPQLPPRSEGYHIVNLRLPCAPGLRLHELTGWFGRPFQWVFANGDGWLTLVGSGWTDDMLADRQAILAQTPALLAQHRLAATGSPRWLVQRHATALQSPAFEQGRPQARAPLENLFFSGAWLATGLPLSMESALAGAERTLRALQSADL